MRTIFNLIFFLAIILALISSGCTEEKGEEPEPEAFLDSDFDGVPDSEDQCEGHDDYEDEDKDGTPDGCDDDY